MSVRRELRFGFSPCPNDTFAFWGAVHGRVDTPGFALRAELQDIETLNERAVSGPDPLELTKLSVPALAHATGRYVALPAGAALGFGCGPLVVRRAGRTEIADLFALRGRRVAVPGRHTTAALLLSLFGPREVEQVPMRFDEVMPAVARGECDAGAIIHESRFTYRSHGLQAVVDLGELWERETGGPLPLGVIAIRRDLGPDLRRQAGLALRASVELAGREPALPWPWVRAHAQELDDAVCEAHVALYVNDFTADLGPRGRAAIDAMLARGRAAGLLPAGPPPWPE